MPHKERPNGNQIRRLRGGSEVGAQVKPAPDRTYSAIANRGVKGSDYNLSPDGSAMVWLELMATHARLQIIDVASARPRRRRTTGAIYP